MNQISMKRSFTIEMNDNTTIQATVSIELSTDDEYNAERQVKRCSINGLLIPTQDFISAMIAISQDEEDEEEDEEDDETDDPEQKEQEVIDFYSAAGHGDPIDMLTTDDYPQCAE